jgi:hypothetical protein
LSTTEELLGIKSSGSGLESPEYGRWDPSGWPRGTFYAQKLALTSPSVGIVRSWTQATAVFFSLSFATVKTLVGKPDGERPLGRTRRRWVDNIRMDLGEVGWGDMDWIGLAQDRNRWRALVNSVLNLRVE